VTLKGGVPEPLLSALQCAMLRRRAPLPRAGLLSIAHGAAGDAPVELSAALAFERAPSPVLQDEGLIP